MPFKSNGSLTTDFQEITDSYLWDDETSWNDYINRDDARIITNPDTSLVGLETILDNNMVDTFEDTIYADNNQTIHDVYDREYTSTTYFTREYVYYDGLDYLFDGYYYLHVFVESTPPLGQRATLDSPNASITQGNSFESIGMIPDLGLRETAYEIGILFAYNNYDEYYRVTISQLDDEMEIHTQYGSESSNYDVNASGGVTIDLDTPYIFSIQWTGGDIHFDLLDIDRNLLGSISTGGRFKDPYDGYDGHGFYVLQGREQGNGYFGDVVLV